MEEGKWGRFWRLAGLARVVMVCIVLREFLQSQKAWIFPHFSQRSSQQYPSITNSTPTAISTPSKSSPCRPATRTQTPQFRI